MTKAEIVSKVSNNLGLDKNEVLATVENLMEEIKGSLNNGENVYLRGFGSFIVKKRKAREARNPATNETVSLKERFVPTFKVSKILKKEVNQSLLRGF